MRVSGSSVPSGVDSLKWCFLRSFEHGENVKMKLVTQGNAVQRIASILVVPVLALVPAGLSQGASDDLAITVSMNVPNELNPPFVNKSGGAANATPEQAAAFA